MSDISISDTGKKQIEKTVIAHKSQIRLAKFKDFAASQDVFIENQSGFINPIIEETFKKLRDDQIISYLRIFYKDGLLQVMKNHESIPEQYKYYKKQAEYFIKKINCIPDIKKIGLRMTEEGEFVRFDGEIVKYEEEILQDILSSNKLKDVRDFLKNAEEVINSESDDASDSATNSGKALEGVLKYIYFKVSPEREPVSRLNLDECLNFYINKLAADSIQFIHRDEPIHKLLIDIKDEFRNIASHYVVDDLTTFSAKKIPPAEGLLCLWTSKAIIVFLLDRLPKYLQNRVD